MDYFYIFCFSLIYSIIGYLLGSVLLGIIFSKIKKIDIRSIGSKNVGSTNVTRALGIKIGMITFIWDSIKSWIAVLFSLVIHFFSKNIYSDIDFFTKNSFIIYISALFVIIGHCFPITYIYALFKNNFQFENCQSLKGGKGAASTAGFYLTVSPIIFIICFLIFWILLSIFKYVSVSSIISIFIGLIMTLIPNLNFFYMLNLSPGLEILPDVGSFTSNFYSPKINYMSNSQYLYFTSSLTFIIFIIILLKHKDNIKRLIKGEESKIFKK